MGLRSWLFGDPPHAAEVANPEPPRQYGNLAAGASPRDLAARARPDRSVSEEDSDEAPSGPGLPRGFDRTTRKLLHRIRADHLSKASNLTSKLKELEQSFEGATSKKEIQDIARSARALSPNLGKFRKLERGLEKRFDSHFKKLEQGGATPSELRSAQRDWDHRYGRDMRKLERRLRNPSRYL